MNTLVLSGTVVSMDTLRYTPAGLPLLNFILHHQGLNIEAGMQRKVECEVNAVAIGEVAKTNFKTGDQIKATGFLAKRSAKSTQLVMHIQHIEII